MSFASAKYRGWSAIIEVDDVTALGADDYNSTENGNAGYPVIADPEGIGVNQVAASYQGKNLKTTVGRQRILHGSQRFLGAVGWRQNEQTYDGIRIEWKPADNMSVDLGYVVHVDRIFGPEDGANPSDLEGDSFVARLDYQLHGEHRLSAFGYLLEFDRQRNYAAGKTVDSSTDTYGLSYHGKVGLLTLAAAWATQADAGDSTQDFRAEYYSLDAAADLGVVTLRLGHEALGTDNNVGFKTPLATLHKFQGWADKFLGTPADGIEDTYVSASTSLGKLKVMAVYHDFSAESGGEDLGSELDAVLTWPLMKQVTLQAKYAGFSSDNNSRYADTDKFWVTLQLTL